VLSAPVFLSKNASRRGIKGAGGPLYPMLATNTSKLADDWTRTEQSEFNESNGDCFSHMSLKKQLEENKRIKRRSQPLAKWLRCFNENKAILKVANVA